MPLLRGLFHPPIIPSSAAATAPSAERLYGRSEFLAPLPPATVRWRNPRGWPETGPYRSRVEPTRRRALDLADAGPGDAAVVPAAGEVAWRLTVCAHRPEGPRSPARTMPA